MGELTEAVKRSRFAAEMDAKIFVLLPTDEVYEADLFKKKKFAGHKRLARLIINCSNWQQSRWRV